ncbi:MAG: hypothetical protein STSR0008_24050 [Ignavibacterium sp.]
MSLILDKEQRDKILQLIKGHINEHGNCRVGWAIKEIAGQKYEKSIHNLEKIANTIIQSGEYIKESSKQVEGDWNILINPQYKKDTWINKHPIMFEVVKSLITAIFAIIVSVILSILIIDKSENPKEVQDNEQEVNQNSMDSVSSPKEKNVLQN